mgnify:CR=1 FL=1
MNHNSTTRLASAHALIRTITWQFFLSEGLPISSLGDSDVSVKSETSSLGNSPTNVLDLASKQMIRVLHVDDDLTFLEIAKQCLEAQGRIQVDTVLSAEEALEKLREEEYDAVISDYQMRGKDGLEFLRELRDKGNFIPFIMFTGKGREEVAVRTLNLGADNYVNKNGAPETVYAELAHDIHSVVERAKAEEALLRSEEKYRSLVNDASTAIAVTDLDGRLTYFNRALIDLFGYSAQEMLGNPWIDFLHSEDRVRVQHLFQEILMSRKEPRNFEFRGIRKDGCVLHLMTKPTRLDTKGKTSGFQAIITDISERKKAEEEVQRFSSAVKMSRDGVVITDLNGIIIDANDAAARFYCARQKNDLVGKNAVDIVSPNEREAVLERMKEAAEKGSTELHEYRIETGLGDKSSIELTTTAMKDREGKPYGFVSIVRDVTERKRAALSLAESEAKYRTLVEQSLQGIVVAQGVPPRLVFANPAMIRMSGYTSEELSSLSLECMIHPEDRSAFFSRLEDRFEGKGSPFDNECRAIRKDGKVVWIDVSSSRIQYNGQPAVQATFIDVTERNKALESLRVLNEKLGVVGKLTRHDVRNKLSAVAGNAYLAKKALPNDHQALSYIKRIESACEQSTRILDFAAIYEILGVEERHVVEVGKAVEEAVSLATDLHGVKVVNECRRLVVLADSLLKQLFYNLIDDSLRHGEKVSRIRLHYKEGKSGLKLFYEDDGVGIAYDEKPKIFEGYSKTGTTGYGLTLIRRMMEVYGWTIEEKGVPGKGAQFVITIPTRADSNQKQRHSNKKSFY